jgi:UDP-2,3-diacylglucosamine hydrolase
LEEQRKHIYFASDFHLGVPSHDASLKREKMLVKWLDEIKQDAAEIFLMGDLFDFWFEYKTVVPKGYVRLLGKIAELTDQGIPVHVFRGNHDIWAFDYLRVEAGVQLYRNPVIRTFGSKTFFLAHGDGLGPGDKGYKLLKRVFENKFNQFLFNWLHPDIGTKMGLYFSRRSRIANIAREEKNNANIHMDAEMLTMYSRKKLGQHPDIHYFIFGHRHFPVDYRLSDKSRLILLGDWVTNFTYAVFDGEELYLKSFHND